MNAPAPSSRLAHQRRARTVYGASRKTRPVIGILAAELCVLAFVAFAAAGLIGIAGWLAPGQ